MTDQPVGSISNNIKLSPRARKASEAYLRCDNIELFATLQGYSIESARVAISRWRTKYGEARFPYKRPKSAREEITDITRFSQIWIQHNCTEAAAILGFPTPGSLRSFVVKLRRDHGPKLFPHKRRPAETSTINDSLMREASRLWKDKVAFKTIVEKLGEDAELLKQAIIKDRETNGLQNFPYRGVLVQ